MNRFIVSIKKEEILLRESNNQGRVISFTDKGYQLNVEVISKDYEGFVTDFTCDGILGLYKLSQVIYIAFIIKSECIGNGVSNQPIYIIRQVHFVKLPTIEHSTANKRYLSMIRELINSINIYYSWNEDLTKCQQDSLCQPLSENNHQFPSSMREEFMFNSPIISDFNPFQYLLPLHLIPITIYGYCSIVSTLSTSLLLISRRSIYNNGRRFMTRGIDSNGHVANYVETEQIFIIRDRIIHSFVQIRGSIPIEWSQAPYMKYTPEIKLFDVNNQHLSNSHFDQLNRHYGRITVINLIDQHGDQKRLGDAYQLACQKYNSDTPVIDWIWFDFHAESKHPENLLLLTKEHVRNSGYFSFDLSTNQILNRQSGVLRVNCVDCLDRTNVIQTQFAKDLLMNHWFLKEFQKSGAFWSNDELRQILSNIWSDNADALSLFYSSSKSLKTDYSRTGKRTYQGLLNDGMNSIKRYVMNNYHDGYVCDSINLVFNRVQMMVMTDQVVMKEKKWCFVGERESD